MFHVTGIYLGDHVLLRPYVPKCPLDGEDVTTKRICVAPTVVDCIAGKAGNNVFDETMLTDGSEIFVYRSSSVDYVIANTPDQLEYNEHWYLNPTLFRYVGTIKMDEEGVIQVVTDVELHRVLMVPHHINYFNGMFTHKQLMEYWREEAMTSLEYSTRMVDLM